MPLPILAIAAGLAQYAPSIIKLLTGSDKAEEVAEHVVSIAQAVTGTSTPVDALDAIKADPKLALDFQMAVMAQEAELERAHLEDRQDARARDVGLQKDGRRNTRADYMVACDVIGLIACVVSIVALQIYRPTDGEGLGTITTLLSTIASYFGLSLRDAHTFEFGSSRGSREKDALLARSA